MATTKDLNQLRYELAGARSVHKRSGYANLSGTNTTILNSALSYKQMQKAYLKLAQQAQAPQYQYNVNMVNTSWIETDPLSTPIERKLEADIDQIQLALDRRDTIVL